MREIKFRAWDKEKKKMWQDIELCHDSTNGCDCDSFADFLYNDRFEVMQYTGLHDCKGKEIFESDVVAQTERMEGNRHERAEVTFNGGCFLLENENGFIDTLWLYNMDTVEVIGSIYENPELLTNNL